MMDLREYCRIKWEHARDLKRKGAYPEAIQALGHVFRKDPNDYIVKKTLERMYVRTQDIDGFISLLEEILKDHPRNVKLFGTLKKVKTLAQRTSP